MSNLYKWINPPVKCLLKSPFHGLMSRNTLLLEFRGRKSGRPLSTPISYHLADNAAHCFTKQSFRWWRNLTNGQRVSLTIAGRPVTSSPEVITDDIQKMEAELTRFLKAVPRDAAHSDVALDPKGNPSMHDVRRVAPGMVYLMFPLKESQDED